MNSKKYLEEKIFYIDEGDGWWWSKEDVGAYEYLKNSNAEFNKVMSELLNERSMKISKKPEDKTIGVQAGGHCGYMVREMNKLVDYTYTFEPEYLEFLCLTMNNPHENIFKFNACVGNERNLVGMANHPGGTGANFVNGKGQIPTFLIDDLNLESCDLMQLDLEGFEYFAMLGAMTTINKYRPILCLERYWGGRFNVSEQQMDELLNSLDYKFVCKIGESDYVYKV